MSGRPPGYILETNGVVMKRKQHKHEESVKEFDCCIYFTWTVRKQDAYKQATSGPKLWL